MVLAGFFFWNPGSDLQKSLEGLFRSLLHSILEQCPHYIPHVLPKTWKKARAGSWQAQSDIDIPAKEIRTAFDQLVRNKALYQDHCFCLFIDGLDEYQERPNHDRREMVELLCSWARDSGVKLCVSSREDNVFMNSFSADRRFRLHELTKHDMRRYVRHRLAHLTEGESKDRLIDAIPERAQGIFLWVSVVTKSMRDELENGASAESLFNMLETLPEELHALFSYLLQSLNELCRRRAYRTLKMLLLSKEIRVDFTAFGYSFFETYEIDQEFAIREQFQTQAATLRGDSNFTASRNRQGEKQLNGWCKGLLEVLPERSFRPALVDYTHRSVAEFLALDTVKSEMERYNSGFDSANAVSQLFLAAQSHFPDANDLEAVRSRPYQYAELMEYRHETGMDSTPPFTFLECLASLRRLDQLEFVYGRVLSLVHLPRGVSALRFSRLHVDSSTKRVEASVEIEHPLFIAAVLGNCQYIMWKLDKDPTIAKDCDSMAILGYSLLCCGKYNLGPGHDFTRLQPDWNSTNSLLEQGFIDPMSRSELQPHVWVYFAEYSGMSLVREDIGSLQSRNAYDFNVSIWEHLLACEFLIWLFPSQSPGVDIGFFGKLAESLLERNAVSSTMHASVQVHYPDGEIHSVEVHVEVDTDGEKKKIELQGHYKRDQNPLLIGPPKLRFRDTSEWEVEDSGQRYKEFSFRSWIEYCTYQELPNKDNILRLLDRNAGVVTNAEEVHTVSLKEAVKEGTTNSPISASEGKFRVSRSKDGEVESVPGSISAIATRESYSPPSIFGM